MKVNFITYLNAIVTELKDSLPNHALFHRKAGYDDFINALGNTFKDFEVVSFEADGSVIINKDKVDYQFMITYEKHQIKATALPFRNYKSTQFNAAESIVVATTPYEPSQGEEGLVEDLVEHALFNLGIIPAFRFGFDTNNLQKEMLTEVIPKELANQISYNNIIPGQFGELQIILKSGMQLDVSFRSFQVFQPPIITEVNCAWHVNTDEGIVRMICDRRVEIKVASLINNILKNASKDAILVKRANPAHLIAVLYDQDTVNALTQLAGRDLSNAPTEFLEYAEHYGFEPDHQLKIESSKIASSIAESLASSNITFDDVLTRKLGGPSPTPGVTVRR